VGQLLARPAHFVPVKRFAIDRDEVTVAEYNVFLDVTVAEYNVFLDSVSIAGLASNRDASRRNFPVTGVPWLEATAYCRWRESNGGRLPTEEEWEAAARGKDRRNYPWGDSWLTGAANTAGAKQHARTAVGSLPAGATPSGINDLIGNVWEWTSTFLRPYEGSPVTVDSIGVFVVIRGGAFNTPNSKATAWYRGYNRAKAVPSDLANTGFRCAFSL